MRRPKKKRAVPIPSVGADVEQPISQITTITITEMPPFCNPLDEDMKDIF